MSTPKLLWRRHQGESTTPTCLDLLIKSQKLAGLMKGRSILMTLLDLG